jgi:hypothetical protein
MIYSVTIEDGCPMRYHVNCKAEADFVCGGPAERLALTLQADALREFVRLAREALREIDARFAREASVAQIHPEAARAS